MKIVIFGMGSIGKRHAKILLDGFDAELYAFRSDRSKAGNDLGIKEIFDWDEVARLKADVAFITNPTHLHMETAIKCASLGMHLFIEKPLSNTLEGIDELDSICGGKKLACYAAYCMRFHPVIKKAKELLKGRKILHAGVVCASYLPEWRAGRDHRAVYSSSKGMGGGVLLDLSHEFDYIKYLLGSINDLKGSFGRKTDITVDSEDFADVLMTAGGNVNVNLHLDYFSRMDERHIKIDLDDGYIFGDIQNNRVELCSGGMKQEYQFESTRDDYFREQTKYFFDNIENPSIMNNIRESRETLEKILEFKNG